MQNYVDYEINGVRHRSQRQLSEKEIDDIASRYRDSGMDNPKAMEQEKMGREELMLNKGLKDAYKTYYKKRNGKAWDEKLGDEALVDEYLEQMRFYESNLGSLGILAAQLNGNYYNQQERAALNVMFDSWDKTVPLYAQKTGKWTGLVDYAQAAVTDPSNWAALLATSTIAGAPVAATGRQASKEAAKELIKTSLKKGLVAGGIEGGLVSGTQNAMMQNVEQKLGRREEFSLKETGIAAGGGALVGGTLGGAFGAGGAMLGNKLTKAPMAEEVVTVPTKGKGKGAPKMTPAEAEQALKAGQKFQSQYADPNVTGEARKAAREEFYNNLTDKSRTRFEMMGSRLGKPLSFEQARKRIDGWMGKIGAAEGDDLNAIVDKVVNYKFQAKDISEYTVLVNSLEDEALDALKRAKTANEDLVKPFEAFVNASGMASTLSENLGRGLQFQSKRFRENFDYMTMTQVIEGLSNVTSGAEGRSALKLIDSKLRKGINLTASGINEAFRYNVLGGIETLTTAGLGSLVRTLERPTTRLFASITSADPALARQALVQYAAVGTEVFGALKYAAKSFYHSKNYLGGSQYIEGSNNAPVIGTDQTLLEMGKGLLSIKSLGQWGNSLANAHRLVGRRSMMAIDEFVGQISFKSRALSLALEDELTKGKPMAMAIKDAKKAAQTAYDDQLEATLTGKSPTNRLTLQAMREADENRFMQPLEREGDLMGSLGNFATSLRDNKGATMSIIMTQVMPFIRSPLNLTNYVFEKTPGLSLLSKRFREDLMAGGQKAAEAEAGLYLGSMLWTAAILGTTFEYVNGAGPVTPKGTPDKGRGDVQKLGGNMPNSILVDPETGKRVDLRRADPFTKPMVIMGSVHDVIRYGTSEEHQELIAALALTTAKSLLDNPAMSGLKEVVDSLDSPDGFSGVLQRRVGSFVPLFRLMRNWSDDDYKEAQTVLDELKKNIPGLSESVDDKRDPIFSSPVKRLPQLGMTLNYTYETKDPVLKEILRLVPNIPAPPKTPQEFGGRVDLTKFRMESGRTLYDHYQDTISKVELEGKTLRQALEFVTQNEIYNDELTDPFAGANVRSEGSKASVIKKTILEYRKAALTLLKDDPKVPQAFKDQTFTAEQDAKATTSQSLYLMLEQARRQ